LSWCKRLRGLDVESKKIMLDLEEIRVQLDLEEIRVQLCSAERHRLGGRGQGVGLKVLARNEHVVLCACLRARMWVCVWALVHNEHVVCVYMCVGVCGCGCGWAGTHALECMHTQASGVDPVDVPSLLPDTLLSSHSLDLDKVWLSCAGLRTCVHTPVCARMHSNARASVSARLRANPHAHTWLALPEQSVHTTRLHALYCSSMHGHEHARTYTHTCALAPLVLTTPRRGSLRSCADPARIP